MGATTLAISIAGFLLFPYFSTLSARQFLLLWVCLVAAGDFVTALSMEAVAPTRVAIGPGERRFAADDPKELATVVSGFTDSDVGKVRIRGETWSARLVSTDGPRVQAGYAVRILDRDGLTLLVSAEDHDS